MELFDAMIGHKVIIWMYYTQRRGHIGTCTDIEYCNDGDWAWVEFSDGEEEYIRVENLLGNIS